MDDPPWATKCTVPDCDRMATYRVTEHSESDTGRVTRTQVMCDLHAYDRNRQANASLWALNE